VKTLGLFTDYDKLCDKLVKVNQSIQSKSVNDNDEGAVIYLIKRVKPG